MINCCSLAVVHCSLLVGEVGGNLRMLNKVATFQSRGYIGISKGPHYAFKAEIPLEPSQRY
jgi:hypothetical protein